MALVDEDALVSGRLQFARGESDRLVVESIKNCVAHCLVSPFTGIIPLVRVIKEVKPDVVFNLTQCAFGDRLKDGHICAVLELEGIPYTGAGPRGLMLGRDKALSKYIAAQAGFCVPRFFLAEPGQTKVHSDMGFPLIVKPRYGDSSEGLSQASVVDTKQALLRRIEVLRHCGFEEIICEEFIEGREMTVGILGDRIVRPREMIVGRKDRGAPRISCERFKFDAEYRRRWKVTSEFARLTATQLQKLREYSLKTAAAIEIRDYGRLDMKLTPQNEWVFLEANPNPGLHKRNTTWHGNWDAVDLDAMIAEIVARAHLRGSRGQSGADCCPTFVPD